MGCTKIPSTGGHVLSSGVRERSVILLMLQLAAASSGAGASGGDMRCASLSDSTLR